MAETLLTVEQTAQRLQLSPLTVQRQLKRGALRGIKRGRLWRVPESALLENSSTPDSRSRAAAIVQALQNSDPKTRNAAILTLARTDSRTRALVEKTAMRAVESYAGEDDDFAD